VDAFDRGDRTDHRVLAMSDRLSTIVAIHIGKSKERLRAVSVVSAAPGKGLEGDRYSDGTGTFYKPNCPDREVTLIETEALEALKRDYGIEPLPTRTLRFGHQRVTGY